MDSKEMKNSNPMELEDSQLDQVAGGGAVSGRTVGYNDTCEHFL